MCNNVPKPMYLNQFNPYSSARLGSTFEMLGCPSRQLTVLEAKCMFAQILVDRYGFY
jgi:hypothetical protein